MSEWTEEHRQNQRAGAQRRKICWLVGDFIYEADPEKFSELYQQALIAQSKKAVDRFDVASAA